MKLYYENPYIKEFSAVVTGCEEINCSKSEDKGYIVTLNQTAFYPEGGGQPSDTGKIGEAVVTWVREKGENIYHYTDKPLKIGYEVNCTIDWPHRFSLMQGHTGEHILSGILKSNYSLENIGFHMGSEFITIDINGTLTDEQADYAEEMANRAIYENLPVETAVKSGAELEKIDYRSKLDIKQNVRIVTIAGYDTCACCGVHCRSTGDVGAIKIINRQKYKNGSRLFLLCGWDAINDYAQKNKAIYKLSALLSAKPQEVYNAVEQLLLEKEKISSQLYEAKSRIITDIAEKVPHNSGCISIFENNLNPDELRRLCTLICGQAEVAAVFSGENNLYKYAIGSNSHNITQLTSALNKNFSGRGGGKASMTQGSLTGGEDSIKLFLQQQFESLKQFS